MKAGYSIFEKLRKILESGDKTTFLEKLEKYVGKYEGDEDLTKLLSMAKSLDLSKEEDIRKIREKLIVIEEWRKIEESSANFIPLKSRRLRYGRK